MSYPVICDITPEDYQDRIVKISKQFKVYDTPNRLPTYCLGLSGEVGEVMELIKRYFREGIEPDKQELTKELGDVIAYVALLAHHYDIPLETVMIKNIRKLEDRQKSGNLEGKGNDR
ncbi:MAG TPA: nucleoside triphosphate pyrophosphohydrolase family protein [Candidatus Obscuribacterales bacterium]